MTKTRLYKIWGGIKYRCCNPNSPEYRNYGGRGITVYYKWQRFEPFMKWALNNGYSDVLEIDRINNDKGYLPSNCRFVTRKVNCNNTRNNRVINYGGLSLTLSQWSDKTGLSQDILWSRLKLRWSPERIFTTQPYLGRNQYSK